MADEAFEARDAAAAPVDFETKAGVLGKIPYRATHDGDDAAVGAKADAVWSGTGAGSVISVLKAIWTRLTGLWSSGYADISVSSLTVNQAAGTAAVITANTARKVLMINPPSDCVLYLTTAATGRGWPLFADVPNTISGVECPTNALFVQGLASGAVLGVWEGS